MSPTELLRSILLFGIRLDDLHRAGELIRGASKEDFWFKDNEAFGPHYTTCRPSKDPYLHLVSNLVEEDGEKFFRREMHRQFPLLLQIVGYEHGDNLEHSILNAEELKASLLRKWERGST